MISMQIIAQRKRRNLSKYEGRWVALLDGKVVESATGLPTLMQKIKGKKFRKRPSVFLVPRKDEGPYVLVLLCS